MAANKLILLTGATGYIGGRLLKELEAQGPRVRCLARQPEFLRARVAPLLTPKLSSLWLGLVTPLYARVGRILVDSMRHETVVRDGAALEAFPIRPMGIREAIAAALRNEHHEFAQTRWSDSLSTANPKRDWGGVRFGNRIVDTRTVTVAATPESPCVADGAMPGTFCPVTWWTVGGWNPSRHRNTCGSPQK